MWYGDRKEDARVKEVKVSRQIADGKRKLLAGAFVNLMKQFRLSANTAVRMLWIEEVEGTSEVLRRGVIRPWG